MSCTAQADLIADLQQVFNTQGKITRKLYRTYGTYSENQIRKQFGTFRDAVAAANLEPLILTEDSTGVQNVETNEFAGDRWNISIPATRIDSLDKLLTHAKVDTSIWKVLNYKIKKWEMGAKVGTKDHKRLVIEQLYAVSATLVKDKQLAFIKAELADLAEEFKKEFLHPQVFIRDTRLRVAGNMLEINIPDLHLGKLAWGKETGYQNYDTKIALETFQNALNDLLAQVSHYEFDSILFILGNDLLNSDNAEGTTTSGTHVSNDARYHKTFIVARNMLKDAILKLRTIAPVHVVSCPGNHDRLSSWHLADSLEMYFYGYTDVTVDNSPKTRKYHQYGKCLLMVTHGDQGKRTDYALTMAAEEPRMWGETKYRECHTGHIHQTKVEEFKGVRVRILPALCPPDAWHSSNNFIGNLRVAEAYVWNREKGLVAQFYHNAD